MRYVRHTVKGVGHAHAVGMNGILHVRVVFEINGHRGSLRDFQSRSRNRAVVGEHPHFRVADFFLDEACSEVKSVSVLEFDYLRLLGRRQPPLMLVENV